MHRKSLLKIFYCLLCGLNSLVLIKGQNPEEYNRIYNKTFLETAQKDFDRALLVADSLYSISESPRFKAKSLMLSATLLQQSGDLKKAVSYASQAQNTLKGTSEYLWQGKIAGFLSSQYRILGLYHLSNKYTDQALVAVKNLEDPKIKNNMLGFIMQEKAYYELERKNYRKSLEYIKSSTEYFSLSGQRDSFLIANNEQLAGLNQYYLKNYEQALLHYNAAKKETETMPDHFLKGLIYDGFAKVYTAKKDFSAAKLHLEKAEKISDQSNFLNLKNEIATTSAEYYKLIKDTLKQHKAEEKRQIAAEKIATQSFQFVRDSYQDQIKEKEREQENKETQVQYNYGLIIFVIISVLAVICGIYFYLLRRKKKAVIISSEQVEPISLKDNISITDLHNLTVEEPAKKPIANSVAPEHIAMMTPETERKILARLEKFEETALYLRNTISLPYVASYCNTNTKYLSHLINNYKQKDFNNYINELRINYILKKLSSDPQYHKYKIAALAEEAGFSSQSKFAAAFKKVTAVAPSQYLQNLRNE